MIMGFLIDHTTFFLQADFIKSSQEFDWFLVYITIKPASRTVVFDWLIE